MFVTTDDERIAAHARDDIDVDLIMTNPACKTGSDRIHAATQTLDQAPDFIINLQGDAPLTPVSVIVKMIQTFLDAPNAQVLTPVCALDWEDLDRLRKNKETTPFSGTTAIIDTDGKALWFSKNILPAIRKEPEMREDHAPCPVLQHIGLYGYTPAALRTFCALPPSAYEQLEGLEQLRFIENNISIHTVQINASDTGVQSGIDTPEDLKRAEAYLRKSAP